MSVDAAVQTTPTTPDERPNPWELDAAEVARHVGVDPAEGLSEEEAGSRLTTVGPNELEEAPPRPAWRRLLAQFGDTLILILIGAAVVSFVVTRELKTPLVVLAVVVLNAVIGFVQEGKAERSLEALRDMMVTRSRVRRGGHLVEVDATRLVPGDVVLVEAGDRIPADGRLLVAHQLESEEAALTGESTPSLKSTEPIPVPGLAVGDRRNMVFMNSTVTRGRGELVVTATGMRTEVGRIAGLLARTERDETPLEKQLDALGRSLGKLAGVIVVAVVVIGLARGESLGDLFETAVALAVASIPEGLPAVTAVTLALGVQRMARRNAIVKHLAGVETLGSTNIICSDKTGTLTLNQMTARALVHRGRRHEVTGEGYRADGAIQPADGVDPDPNEALEIMALCSDAVVRDGALVGDPTEGALVALAAKGGIDVMAIRRDRPRLAELPFDSATKLMATFHDDGDGTVAVHVKGAPDVLLARSTSAVGAHGVEPASEAHDYLVSQNAELAARGLRVLAVATRRIDAETFAGTEQLEDLVHDLTLVALVGIVDPPRPEAKVAIAEARSAGIDVKMITGDHAETASAIGRELGLRGRAVTGADLDRMDDEQLEREIDEIGVFARVAPEHKLRLVTALRSRGDVVAMTGDGVNDAPALKRADMGVAMGITGTEVTKEAATMVLTDDNFATIVKAVREGRAIYDNIVAFVRFQLSTTIGFAVVFLLAAAFGIAGGAPFTAVAILWVNLIMDGPPAMALGVDPAREDIMRRPPRPVKERILTRSRWVAVGVAATVMAIGTLAVLQWAPGPAPEAGTATVAGTMAYTTFVLFQVFNIMNARSDRGTVFSRSTLRNRWLWASLGLVLALQVSVVHVPFMQDLFDTTSISLEQWLVCIAVASSVLWVEEVRKFVLRRIRPTRDLTEASPSAGMLTV